ncbi:MAG: YkvA family protein [Novosphingobium sp.]
MSDPIGHSVNADGYRQASFWKKLKRIAGSASRELVEKALWLFYAAQSPSTPAWARRTIYGALAYFVFPVDVIVDFIPGVGLVDDLGAISAAVTAVAFYIDDKVKEKAAEKMRGWFG